MLVSDLEIVREVTPQMLIALARAEGKINFADFYYDEEADDGYYTEEDYENDPSYWIEERLTTKLGMGVWMAYSAEAGQGITSEDIPLSGNKSIFIPFCESWCKLRRILEDKGALVSVDDLGRMLVMMIGGMSLQQVYRAYEGSRFMELYNAIGGDGQRSAHSELGNFFLDHLRKQVTQSARKLKPLTDQTLEAYVSDLTDGQK